MDIGRTINKALKRRGISVVFAEWRAEAQDRDNWRRLITQPRPAQNSP
jgi:hypothetical protein